MKTLRVYVTILFCLCCGIASSQPVDEQSVVRCGVDSYFRSDPIDDTIYNRIRGLSYKDNCTVPLADLRYLRILHYNGDGEIAMGEMVCSRVISDDLLSIFRELFDAQYRIESVRLVDEYGADDNLSMVNNNSSAFNFRYISGTTRLSKHSLGLAVDINPLYNPYVKGVGDELVVEPKEARDYVDRDGDFPFKIDTSDLCYKLFIRHGFEWGGDWSSVKDYQHFERAD